MCNTDRDPNKGKAKMNEEPIVNFKNMDIQKNEKKRKAIVLVEPDVQAKNSKSPNNGDAGEESTNSSKETSPFLLFGFIIDPNKRIKHAYSCNFCSRKFINPQALGGHQNCHKFERIGLKKRIEDMKNDWINYSNDNQGVISQNTIIPSMGGTVSQQITMSMIDYGSVSNGGADNVDVDHKDKEIRKEEESKIDLTLKL